MLKTRETAIDVAMGETLKLHRRAAGLSQSELGQAVGITFQQIQKYESGRNRLSVSRLFQLAGALGIAPSDLVANLEEQVKSTEGSFEASHRERLKFLASWDGGRLVSAIMHLDNPALVAAIADLVSVVEDSRRVA